MNARTPTSFPKTTVTAGESVLRQLQKAPGKTYAEQDALFAVLMHNGYFYIQDLLKKKRINSVGSIDKRPNDREALYLGSAKVCIDEEKEIYQTYAIYLHKKTGNYYKYSE